MMKRDGSSDHRENALTPKKSVTSLAIYYVKWIGIASIVGVGCGIASAGFLAALAWVTDFRITHSWLLYLLPVGGLVVGLVYHTYGRSVEGGNNLIIDEFHDPKSVIPFRMAPLVLFGTILTHLFGGSAGREGTAVQMGGSIADQLAHRFKMNHNERRTLLMAGMAGGFGSVFGVPFAGMIFGLEVLAVGRLHLWGILECAVAAFVAHHVTLAFGIHHAIYSHPAIPDLTAVTALAAIFAGMLFGVAARLFAILTGQVSRIAKSTIPYLPLRAMAGGAIISLIFFFSPMLTRYAGLGVPIIIESIQNPVMVYDWLGKLVLTALTLGVGFKGGEVTPLLFIGSTLGNALSGLLPLPLPLLAATGFVAVFAGAANTPFACTVMAMEIFGPNIWPFAALACFASYAVSGHHGIYHAQRSHPHKSRSSGRTTKMFKFLFRRPSLDETRTDGN